MIKLSDYIKISYINLSNKTFYSLIRDILTTDNFKNKYEKEENKTTKTVNLNDAIYYILKELNIEDDIIKSRCLIRIPQHKKEAEDIQEKQATKSQYYKTYYEKHKSDIINRNLERYYRKKQGI